GGWLAHTGSDADAAWFWEPIKLNEMVRAHQPKCVINPRSGWAGDFQTDEGTHEITGDIIPFPWEKCFSIASYWSYDAEGRLMPIEQILTLMINCFIRGGNVLLNVAPTADGEIPLNQRNHLQAIGQFMQQYGEAIYGTRPGPLQPADHVYGMTHKGDKLYVHVLNGQLFSGMMLPAISNKIIDCRLLNGEELPFEQQHQGIKIHVTAEQWQPLVTVI